MMETMIPPQVGMSLRTLQKKKPKKPQKKEAKEAHQKKRENKIKNERKREKGQCYYPFTTLVLQSSTIIFIERVSYAFTFIY